MQSQVGIFYVSKNMMNYGQPGNRINPLLIYSFLPQAGERPTIISMDVNGGHNRFFTTGMVDSTTVDLNEGQGRFSYTYVGKTANNIQLFRTTLTKGSSTTQALLFFSFTERAFAYENTSLNRPLITLEKFYWLGSRTDAQVSIKGDKVIIDKPGTEKSHIELSTENDNTSQILLDTKYSPVGFSAALQKDWDEIDKRFYFQGNPINPYIMDELNGGGFAMSDGSTTMVIDLKAANASKQFKDTAAQKGTSFTTSTISYGMPYQTSFGYQYLGKTDNGVHVVRTSYWGGGTGVFSNIYFIRFKIRKGFDFDGIGNDQILMCIEGYCPERDRSTGNVKIKNNTISIDIPERQNPVSEPYDTTHVVVKF